MSITLQLQSSVTTQTEPTDRALDIAAMFGLSIDGTHEHVILPPIGLTLAPGQVIFVTGVSGGGKSTLLHAISDALDSEKTQKGDDAWPGVIWNDRLRALPDRPLVEALARPECESDTVVPDADLSTVCRWLSLAGLNDAAVMLRRPGELSEGQRYRLRLAQSIASAERRPEAWSVLLADELGSSLDRATAGALAQSIRRWVTRSNVCLVAATAHDDLLEPLGPDVLVDVAPGGNCAVHYRPA